MEDSFLQNKQKRGNVHMIAHLAQEIELTDAQLETIFGAHGHCHHNSSPQSAGGPQANSDPQSSSTPPVPSTHLMVGDAICERFKISLEISIDIEVDEEFATYLDGWN
jgi:activator of HSP90 ATPase